MEVKACPVCNRSLSKKQSKNVTCSRACANTFFRSGVNNGQYRKGEDNYRTICSLYHEHRCVVCGEEKILDCHHWDENHSNNEPSNLVFLCPTHHRYLHSRYRHECEARVNEYRERFLEAHTQELYEDYEVLDLQFGV